jgi:UDP-glucose 4-epimerase
MNDSVLVTGGAGYVGSHVVAALARVGIGSVVLDDFSNSSRAVVGRLGQITGAHVPLVEADVRDLDALRATFAAHRIGAVVHCAGLKAVGESAERPLDYWSVNVGGTLALTQAMREAHVGILAFSSSATVYGQPEALPVREDAPLSPQSVYGRTKLAVEVLLEDLARADSRWRVAILRYFNPAGAHPSACIGEAPRGRPNNLVPFLSRTVAGDYPELAVFGSDWPTPDGTGVRDYIHVDDLAEGHVAAVRWLASRPGAWTFNLGVGRGYSVLDVVAAFEHASGRDIRRRFAPRRSGDVAAVYADPSKAHRELGWRAVRGLDAICTDAWRWQQTGGKYDA